MTTSESLSPEGATGVVGLQLEGSGFESLKKIPVNREGETLYNLNPKKFGVGSTGWLVETQSSGRTMSRSSPLDLRCWWRTKRRFRLKWVFSAQRMATCSRLRRFSLAMRGQHRLERRTNTRSSYDRIRDLGMTGLQSDCSGKICSKGRRGR